MDARRHDSWHKSAFSPVEIKVTCNVCNVNRIYIEPLVAGHF